MRVILLGARGFVGSAFARLLSQKPDVELVEVEIDNYDKVAGTAGDIVIEAACNSRKFFADEQPVAEFETSVTHRLKSLFDFTAPFHLHISRVDVYSDLTAPKTTREDSAVDLVKSSHYGFHKLMAEQLVQHYARKWLIVRLAGMVGPGLRKNPIFDILNEQALRIHPDSKYQFLHTEDVARLVWGLVESGAHQQVFNVAGDGLISPREIAAMAGKNLNLGSLEPGTTPRIVHASITKIKKVASIPKTKGTVARFIQQFHKKVAT